MEALCIRPVQSRRDRRAFLDLPWRLYAGDRHWVPPPPGMEAALAGLAPHPFWIHNEAQCYLALRGDDVVGRIAAIDNRQHAARHGERLACFGFFECRDDGDAARGLLETVRRWAARRGLEHLRGPLSPSINYQAGLLIDGFDQRPAFLTPYNPPYYATLMAQCGLVKAHDLLAFRADRSLADQALPRLDRVAERLARRRRVQIRPLNRWRRRRDLHAFLHIVNESLVGHWGFVPLPRAELDWLASRLRWLLDPNLVLGAEVDGRLVGVALAMPDYGQRLQELRGRLFPFGWLRLLATRRTLRRCRVIAANVLPQFVRSGLGVMLTHAVVSRALASGAQEVEFSWVAESNAASRGTLENGGARAVRTYRVYDDPRPLSSA
jgi:GNAT superfamily N-acetyltransferase